MLTQRLLDSEISIKRSIVRNSLRVDDKIKAFRLDRIVLVLVLADLKEDFDHVLHSLANSSFVEYRSEALVDRIVHFG